MSYVTIDGTRKFIEKEGLRKLTVFDFKVETIPQEDSALNPRRLDFGDIPDDDSSSSSSPSEYSSDEEESDEESESGAETEDEGENYSLYPFTYDFNYTNA